MSAGGVNYAFYFAWVPQGTPWSLSLARFDENIFDMLIEHDEGQIPTATVEIKNPRIGLINPNRNYWAWISYSRDGCTPQPLFNGRLVGIPEEILFNTLKMKFIARPPDYAYQKQQVARSLKTSPNYSPIWLDVAKRDDPDSILEGWAALYHVDRVNLRVSASDILVGEDGTIVFAPQDVFYDNLMFRILQSPLVAVNVKAEVQWAQQYRGALFMGQWAWPTLGSDAFVGDWPKSGSNLGGGWYAGVSWAGERDPSIETQALLTLQPQVVSYSYQWTNTAKTHTFGDTMSISINYSPPWGHQIILREVDQIGIQNPYNVDSGGNPDPINQPAKINIDWFCYRTFALNFLGKQSLAVLSLVYMADRKRSERLDMTIQANVQPVLIDPLVVEDTEQITLKSGDLSLPQTELLNWDEVGMGGAVSQGTIIFPDNPLVPGQTSSQIALNNGHTGMTIPTFSNVAGQTTQDNTVTWVSLGDTPPSDGAQDWLKLARVPLGTLVLPKPVSGVPDLNSIEIPGTLNYPPTGTAVPIYSVFSQGNAGPGDLMYEVTQSGILGGLSPNQAVLRNFINPSGKYLHIAIQAGVTGQFHPTWNETSGGQTADGTVIWQNIGLVDLPIGGSPGMTPAASFFPTDRGQQELLHLVARARAKLRKRARAGELSFNTRFEVGAQLSCRMSGVVPDVRLPGGSAGGKVVSYKLRVNGDTGEVDASVVLGCSIGGTYVAPAVDAGVPSYVKTGYVKPGYQKYYSALMHGSTNLAQQNVTFAFPPTPLNWPAVPPTLPPPTCPPLASFWEPHTSPSAVLEWGYTPPISEPNDDGLTFPVSLGDVVLKSGWHGLASTLNPLNIVSYQLQLDQIVHDAVAQANQTKPLNFPAVGGVASGTVTMPISPFFDIQIAVEQAVLKSMLQGTGLWYELVLKPLTNGPFSTAYVISSTPLPIEQTVNLSAPSLGG